MRDSNLNITLVAAMLVFGRVKPTLQSSGLTDRLYRHVYPATLFGAELYTLSAAEQRIDAFG